MAKVNFVPADKVPGLAVLVCMPVGPVSAAALCAALRGEPLQKDDAGKPLASGCVELGAACAAAAGRIQGALAGPGKLKTTRCASVEFGAHEGHFCVGVVTDRAAARVKAVVKAAVSEAARVSAGEHNRFARGLGLAPQQTEECLKALQRGAAEASVVVCGPLAKPEQQRRAVEKAREGHAAAGVSKPAGAPPKSDRPAVACPGQFALAAKGAALAVLHDYVRGTLRLGGAICGDRVVIPARSASAAQTAGANKDKKARLLAALEKPGEAGRAFWRACALGVHAGTSAPAPKALADGVFAALK